MNAEILTPLPEVHYRSQRIRVHIPFPSWVDTNNMGINLTSTERLMNIGGIKHVRIVGDVNGERTSSMPASLGVAPDGSQYAGMAGAKETVKLNSLESQGDNRHYILKNAEWASTTVQINLEEVQRQIAEKKGNLRRADSWVPYLDRTLRWGIRKAGSEHLLTHFTRYQKIMFFLVNIHNNLLMASSLSIFDLLTRKQPVIPTAGDLLTWTCFNMIIWPILESITYGLERGGSGYRLSIFPGYEIDRALVLQVLSRTNKLVKTIPPQK